MRLSTMHNTDEPFLARALRVPAEANNAKFGSFDDRLLGEGPDYGAQGSGLETLKPRAGEMRRVERLGVGLAVVLALSMAVAASASAENTTLTFESSFQHYESIERSASVPGIEPTVVAVGPSGTIYAADQKRILEFGANREYVGQIGEGGQGNGQFDNEVGGMAINAAGDLYVTSQARVQEFSPDGEYLGGFGSYGSGNGQLNEPSGIAIDPSGDIWVLDSGNHRVQEFSPTGEYLSQFGEKGTGPGQMGWGVSLAFSDGNLYVAEAYESRIQEFSLAGEYVRQFDEAGSGDGKSNICPWGIQFGIAADPNTGNLYVVEGGGTPEFTNNRVQEFSSGGSFITTFGLGSGPHGQPIGPRGVAVGPSGKIYVADAGTGWVQEWLPASDSGEPPTYATSFTHYETFMVSELGEPDAVALDPSGNIYVVDSNHEHILKFNPEHHFLTQFGNGGGSNDGQFHGIGGIATNTSGDLYATDLENDRVQEFSPSGEYLRQFGSYGSGSGQFEWYGTAGIAVDSAGNVWVLDSNSHRVEEFSPTGEYLAQFSIGGPGVGLAFSDGDLYVVGIGVQEFSTSGEYVRQFDEGLHDVPWGIATDPTTDDLYVVEAESNRVQEFSPEGTLLAAYGSPGTGDGQFSDPRGVAFNSSGDLFVADRGNRRVQEWVPTAATGEAAMPTDTPVSPTSAGSANTVAPAISGTAQNVSGASAPARMKSPVGSAKLIKCTKVAKSAKGKKTAIRRCSRPRGHATKSSTRRARTSLHRP